MKSFILFLLLVLIGCQSPNKSTDHGIDPASPSYETKDIYCGVSIIVSNGGCERCFIVSYGAPFKKMPAIIDGIPGIEVLPMRSDYVCPFRVDETSDTRRTLKLMHMSVKDYLCK